MKAVAAIVEQAEETETQLIERAQAALSSCNWVVGECASKWCVRYADGRTDDDFGRLVGLSGDQVRQRRNVWERMGDVSDMYPELSWSHFYVAMNWDDAPELLQWADEMGASVAEMKAYRRSIRGEDLTEPADEEPETEPIQIVRETAPKTRQEPAADSPVKPATQRQDDPETADERRERRDQSFDSETAAKRLRETVIATIQCWPESLRGEAVRVLREILEEL